MMNTQEQSENFTLMPLFALALFVIGASLLSPPNDQSKIQRLSQAQKTGYRIYTSSHSIEDNSISSVLHNKV